MVLSLEKATIQYKESAGLGRLTTMTQTNLLKVYNLPIFILNITYTIKLVFMFFVTKLL